MVLSTTWRLPLSRNGQGTTFRSIRLMSARSIQRALPTHTRVTRDSRGGGFDIVPLGHRRTDSSIREAPPGAGTADRHPKVVARATCSFTSVFIDDGCEMGRLEDRAFLALMSAPASARAATSDRTS